MKGLVLSTIALLGLVAVPGLLYLRDIAAIRARLAAGSRVVATSHGPIEVAVTGEGPAVLVVHGAGGGYDQGRLMVEAFGPPGFRYIVVSRFGYLRTPLPANASTSAQADAFAALLDALGIERAAVLAMSGGVPPALQLASRHPGRTCALVLLSSAPFTPLAQADQALPLPAWAYRLLFASDFPFWVLQRVARPMLARLFDAPPALRQELAEGERAFLWAMIDAFQPVSQRHAGLANEAAAIDPQAHYALERVTAPTLVVHAHDDGINSFAIARRLAEAIPGALLRPLSSGGHLLLGHHAELSQWIAQVLQKKACGDLSQKTGHPESRVPPSQDR